MSGKRAVLQALRAADPDRGASGAELYAVAGRRFGARILELRRDGHEIETIRPVNGGDFHYRMLRDAGYQRAAKATTEGVTPGPSRPVSDSPASSPSAPALFELPPARPANAIDDAAAA